MHSSHRRFNLDAHTSALVVIDMQNDFLDPGGYFAHRGLDVGRLARAIAPIASLRERLPSEMRTVFTKHVYEPDGSDDLQTVHRLNPTRLARSTSGRPVIRGSWGAGIVPALSPRCQDLVVAKRRFDAFHQTDLELLLRCWGVKTLILAGVVADVCVESTLRSAYVRDFDVVLARECVGAWTEDDLERTTTVVENSFGVVATIEEIVDSF